jgi:hypothetical protein
VVLVPLDGAAVATLVERLVQSTPLNRSRQEKMSDARHSVGSIQQSCGSHAKNPLLMKEKVA